MLIAWNMRTSTKLAPTSLLHMHIISSLLGSSLSSASGLHSFLHTSPLPMAIVFVNYIFSHWVNITKLVKNVFNFILSFGLRIVEFVKFYRTGVRFGPASFHYTFRLITRSQRLEKSAWIFFFEQFLNHYLLIVGLLVRKIIALRNESSFIIHTFWVALRGRPSAHFHIIHNFLQFFIIFLNLFSLPMFLMNFEHNFILFCDINLFHQQSVCIIIMLDSIRSHTIKVIEVWIMII